MSATQAVKRIRRSAKSAKADREFHKVCKERDAKFAKGKCEWPGCSDPWTERHHVLRRRDFALALPFARVFLARLLCRFHHQFITDNPAAAKSGGWVMTLAECVARGWARFSNKFNGKAEDQQ